MYFRFQDPIFAILVIIIVLVFWLRKFWGRHASLRFSSNWAINEIVKKRRSRLRVVLILLRFLMLVCLTTALMRPQIGRKWTETKAEGIDIMLAIDLSGSMRAHDFEKDGKLVSRLEIVKEVVNDFITQRIYDRIGLVIFAEEPFLVSPLTTYHDWLVENFNRLEIGIVRPNSTAIGSAIGMAVNRLRHVESESKVMILLTDGENNAGKLPPIAAAETANAFQVKIYSIGVGKTGSVLMPRVRDNQVITNESGHSVMDWVESDIDEFTLQEAAHITGGKYFRATRTEGLKSIYEEIDKMEKTEVEIVHYDNSTELMFYPMLLGLILLILEIILNRTFLHKIP